MIYHGVVLYFQTGYTCLIMAAYYEQRDTVEMLLELGADVQARTHVRAQLRGLKCTILVPHRDSLAITNLG